jgi:hypothetical protein
MAENPLRKGDRILQTKYQVGDVKQSVTLYDIDYAIMSYLEDVALPNLSDAQSTTIKIPVIYGNSERWNGARRQGVYRDNKGRIQLPLMMVRRTTVAKNDAMPMLNRHVTYPTITKWNKKNRYDRFSVLNGVTPSYDLFNITMPDYVEVNYECMAWTSFTEQMNVIIEALNFASDEYWGDKTRFKFYSIVSDYNVVNEVNDNQERVNRLEFTLNVKAYLLPEKFASENTTKKSQSINRVVVTSETDLTADGRLETMLTTQSPYYDNKDLIDYLSINSSDFMIYVSDNIFSLQNIKLIKTPAAFSTVITTEYDIKIYINGVRYYETTHYTYSMTGSTLTVVFNNINLGWDVVSTDEVTITGKYIQLV